ACAPRGGLPPTPTPHRHLRHRGAVGCGRSPEVRAAQIPRGGCRELPFVRGTPRAARAPNPSPPPNRSRHPARTVGGGRTPPRRSSRHPSEPGSETEPESDLRGRRPTSEPESDVRGRRPTSEPESDVRVRRPSPTSE